MESSHNPDRYISDLRQILSQGRKRIGILVGAGAPLAIKVDREGKLSPSGNSLIPDIAQLTNDCLQNLNGDSATAANAIKNELGSKANIESILSRVRLLQEVLGNIKVNGLDGPGYKLLGQEICKTIGSAVGVNLPDERNPYHELVSWISGTLRTHPVEIFTTNYDLLFEEAFEKARAPYFDGFTGGSSPFFDPVSVASDDLPARWSRLWKLHGSIGWALENGMVVRGKGKTENQLVYPDHLKYDLTQKQPYSALFERLKDFLLTPDTLLLTIGFSFRDAHICAVLDEALSMNSNTAVIAFQYGKLEAEEPARHLAFLRPNLSVYAADSAVINGIPGLWRIGEPPKNWLNIRASFWGTRNTDSNVFLLGDFSYFARFCALAQATDIHREAPATTSTAAPAASAETLSDQS